MNKIKDIISEIVDTSISYEDFVSDLKNGVKFKKPVKFLANDMKAYFIVEMQILKETLSQYSIVITTKNSDTLKFRIKHYRIKLFYDTLQTKYNTT